MNVRIVKALNLDNEIFHRLEDLLKPFSNEINFIFNDGGFEEDCEIWNWDELERKMESYRKLVALNDDDFLIFLTTKRNELNWFSTCFKGWNRNIFVSTIEWTKDNIIENDKSEYPIAYQIIENIFQFLTSSNFQEFEKAAHKSPIGCINDECSNKLDIIFKLRTADICSECQKLAEKRINPKVYEQFIEILENIRFQFLHNKKNFMIFQRIVNKAKIDYLREIKTFINKNLDKSESFIQAWLDEDNGRYRKQRSLIFGMDYIDPKREGEIFMRKRFDILAEQNLNSHIIIELKSPNAKIFDIKSTKNKNGGETTEYSISQDLSRAIPQILSYKKWYEEISPEIIQSLGIIDKKTVSECIIVIGQRSDDPVWKSNFDALKNNISVKILTYNDLIDKIENTIKNFENILNN